MQIDKIKIHDQYMQLTSINLSIPDKTLKDLYIDTALYRENAVNIYTMLMHTLYVELPPELNRIKVYANTKEFEKIEKLIQNADNNEELAEYEQVLKERKEMLQEKGIKFNKQIEHYIEYIKKNCVTLRNQSREDLQSDVFLYGKIQAAMKERGKQIESLGELIKNVYIKEINELRESIKAYNTEIDKYIDPQNSFDAFMKALPNADDFANLTKFAEKKADAQVDAVKAVYSIAINGITYIGNKIINFENMEERRKLQEKLHEVEKAYEANKETYENIINQYNLVKNLVIVLEGMQFFADEGEVVVNGLSRYLKKLDKALVNENVSEYYSCIAEVEEVLSVFWTI